MKIHPYASFILSTCLLLNLSCSNNSNGDNNGTKANLSEDFITKNDLGEAFSVKEIRERVPSGQEFIVEGFIGGRKKPFTQNSAVLILGDHSLETCDEIPGDSCPTPWDVCCEDRKKVASSIISVQVLESNGSVLVGTLDGVSGLEAGSKVKVKGRLDQKSQSGTFIINAKNIQILEN